MNVVNSRGGSFLISGDEARRAVVRPAVPDASCFAEPGLDHVERRPRLEACRSHPPVLRVLIHTAVLE